MENNPLLQGSYSPGKIFILTAMERIKKAKTSKLTPAAIKFRQWLIDNDMSVPQAGFRTGFDSKTLYSYICGSPKSYPSLAQAYALEWLTDGKVMAWEWLDNEYVAEKIRTSQAKRARRFERDVKKLVLKYNSLKKPEGMIRQKARILSRLFGVEWSEVKRRCWEDARNRGFKERADIKNLLEEPITEEEDRRCDYAKI